MSQEVDTDLSADIDLTVDLMTDTDSAWSNVKTNNSVEDVVTNRSIIISKQKSCGGRTTNLHRLASEESFIALKHNKSVISKSSNCVHRLGFDVHKHLLKRSCSFVADDPANFRPENIREELKQNPRSTPIWRRPDSRSRSRPGSRTRSGSISRGAKSRNRKVLKPVADTLSSKLRKGVKREIDRKSGDKCRVQNFSSPKRTQEKSNIKPSSKGEEQVRGYSPKFKLIRQVSSPSPNASPTKGVKTLPKNTQRSFKQKTFDKCSPSKEATLTFPVGRVIKVRQVSPEVVMPDIIYGPPMFDVRSHSKKQKHQLFDIENTRSYTANSTSNTVVYSCSGQKVLASSSLVRTHRLISPKTYGSKCRIGVSSRYKRSSLYGRSSATSQDVCKISISRSKVQNTAQRDRCIESDEPKSSSPSRPEDTVQPTTDAKQTKTDRFKMASGESDHFFSGSDPKSSDLDNPYKSCDANSPFKRPVCRGEYDGDGEMECEFYVEDCGNGVKSDSCSEDDVCASGKSRRIRSRSCNDTERDRSYTYVDDDKDSDTGEDSNISSPDASLKKRSIQESENSYSDSQESKNKMKKEERLVHSEVTGAKAKSHALSDIPLVASGSSNSCRVTEERSPPPSEPDESYSESLEGSGSSANGECSTIKSATSVASYGSHAEYTAVLYCRKDNNENKTHSNSMGTDVSSSDAESEVQDDGWTCNEKVLNGDSGKSVPGNISNRNGDLESVSTQCASDEEEKEEMLNEEGKTIEIQLQLSQTTSSQTEDCCIEGGKQTAGADTVSVLSLENESGEDTPRATVREMVKSLQERITSPSRSPPKIIPPLRREVTDWKIRTSAEDGYGVVETHSCIPGYDKTNRPTPLPRKRNYNTAGHSSRSSLQGDKALSTRSEYYLMIRDATSTSAKRPDVFDKDLEKKATTTYSLTPVVDETTVANTLQNGVLDAETPCNEDCSSDTVPSSQTKINEAKSKDDEEGSSCIAQLPTETHELRSITADYDIPSTSHKVTGNMGKMFTDAVDQAKTALRRIRSRSLSPAQVGSRISSLVEKGKTSISSTIKSWSNTDTTSGNANDTGCRHPHIGTHKSLHAFPDSSEPVPGSSRDNDVSEGSTTTSSLHGDSHEPIYCLRIQTPSTSAERGRSTLSNTHRGRSPYLKGEKFASGTMGSSPKTSSGKESTSSTTHNTCIKCDLEPKPKKFVKAGSTSKSLSNAFTTRKSSIGSNSHTSERAGTSSSSLHAVRPKSPPLESILETESVSEDGESNHQDYPSESFNVDEIPCEALNVLGTMNPQNGCCKTFKVDTNATNGQCANSLVPVGGAVGKNVKVIPYHEVPTRASHSDCSRNVKHGDNGDTSQQQDDNVVLKTQSLGNASDVALSDSGMALLSQEASIKRCPSFPDLTDLNDEDGLGEIGQPAAPKDSLTAIQAMADLDLDEDEIAVPHSLSLARTCFEAGDQGVFHFVQQPGSSNSGNAVSGVYRQATDNTPGALLRLGQIGNHTEHTTVVSSDGVNAQENSKIPTKTTPGVDDILEIENSLDPTLKPRSSSPPIHASVDLNGLCNKLGHHNSPQTGVCEPVVGTIVSLLESCKVLSDPDIVPVPLHGSCVSTNPEDGHKTSSIEYESFPNTVEGGCNVDAKLLFGGTSCNGVPTVSVEPSVNVDEEVETKDCTVPSADNALSKVQSLQGNSSTLELKQNYEPSDHSSEDLNLPSPPTFSPWDSSEERDDPTSKHDFTIDPAPGPSCELDYASVTDVLNTVSVVAYSIPNLEKDPVTQSNKLAGDAIEKGEFPKHDKQPPNTVTDMRRPTVKPRTRILVHSSSERQKNTTENVNENDKEIMVGTRIETLVEDVQTKDTSQKDMIECGVLDKTQDKECEDLVEKEVEDFGDPNKSPEEDLGAPTKPVEEECVAAAKLQDLEDTMDTDCLLCSADQDSSLSGILAISGASSGRVSPIENETESSTNVIRNQETVANSDINNAECNKSVAGFEDELNRKIESVEKLTKQKDINFVIQDESESCTKQAVQMSTNRIKQTIQDDDKDDEECDLSSAASEPIINKKLSFHSKDSSACDLSLTSQSRSYKSFSTDEDKSSGAGETLPLVSDAEVKKRKKMKIKRIPSGEGPSRQRIRTGITGSNRTGGPSRALSDQNSPDLNIAGGSGSMPLRFGASQASRPPKAALAQRTKSAGSGQVRKEIKWDDDISCDDLDDLSTQSSSDISSSSNKCNSCTPISSKTRNVIRNQAKLSSVKNNTNHGVSASGMVIREKSRKQKEPDLSMKMSYKAKVIRSPPPAGLASFNAGSCLRKEDPPFVTKTNDLATATLSSSSKHCQNSDSSLSVDNEGSGAYNESLDTQRLLYNQNDQSEMNVDTETLCGDKVEHVQETRDHEVISGVNIKDNEKTEIEEGINKSSSCLAESPPCENVPDFHLNPTSVDSQQLELHESGFPLNESHTVLEPLTFINSISSLPPDSNPPPPPSTQEEPFSVTFPEISIHNHYVGSQFSNVSLASSSSDTMLSFSHNSSGMPSHFSNINVNSTNIPSFSSEILRFHETNSDIFPQPETLEPAASENTKTFQENQRRISRIRQHVHKTNAGLTRAYDFVSRSQRHLDRCDFIIERSSDIIRRSQEMLAAARLQMERTVRSMSVRERDGSS